MRSSGTDCLVVVTKRGNARGAKGTGHSSHDRFGQLATGGTARSLRRERPLSLNGKSRVSREAQARICERLGVRFPGATRPRGATPRGYSTGHLMFLLQSLLTRWTLSSPEDVPADWP